MIVTKQSVSSTDVENQLAAILRSDLAQHQKKLQYKPRPGQLAFHQSPAVIRFLCTGNRWGKSYAAAWECNFWARGDHPYQQVPDPPVRIRVLADGFEYGIDKILMPIFRDIVDPRNLHGGSWDRAYSRKAHTLRYANGSTIEFMSYKLADLGRGAQMFAGVELDLLWPDEHSPETVWIENQMRIGRRPMRSIVTLTPVLGKTWEYEQLYEPWANKTVPVSQVECFEGSIEDNIYLSDEAIANVLRTIKDPKQLDVRTKGTWINLGGDVYSIWDADFHFIPVDPERIRKATKTVIIDPHPSKAEAVLWCGVDTKGMFAYREYKAKKTVREVCDDIRRLSQEYGEDIRRFLIDPHWGWEEKETQKSKAQLYRDNRIPVEPAFNGRDHDLIASMTEALEVSPTTGRARFEVMKSCPELKYEFEHNKYKSQTEAMVEADRWKRVKAHDDLLVCAEYYVKSDPRYLGRKRVKGKPVRSALQEAMFS